MNKELSLSSTQTIQKNLWGKVCGENGMESRITAARGGHLPTGLILNEIIGNQGQFAAILGEFAPRVLIASSPNNPMSLIPEQIAVAGGWCALRTNDVKKLTAKEPIIMSPETGVIEPVTSVTQVAEWIKQSISFDQIIESVGAVNASEFGVISEQQLWTERMISKLSAIFTRRLTPEEQGKIADAVKSAEEIRAEITKRYLIRVTNNDSITFNRIVDADIWKDIQYAQVDMLSRVDLSVAKLERMFPDDAEVIKSSALVWSMYSEPYFDMLRSKGAITKPTVFIVEPSLHTYADTRPGREVVRRIYQDKGKYFDPKGINPNTGFIAFMECITPDGKNARKSLSVGEVPNIRNWRKMFQDDGALSVERNTIIDLKQNLLFVWGVNLLPFGVCRQKLLELAEIQKRFQTEKATIGGIFSNTERKDKSVQATIQTRTEQLRQEMLIEVADTNVVIVEELTSLFTFLTEGLL